MEADEGRDKAAEAGEMMRITIRGVNYAARLLPKKLWCDIWLPAWHNGRGRYVSIGLWLFAFYRGY